MATTISNPVLAWTASIIAGKAVAQSTAITATVSIASNYEIVLPFKATFTTVSEDPAIEVYRSTDNGTTYDTQSFVSLSIPRVTSGDSQYSLALPTGIYAIKILNSGPNTATFYIQTAQVLTAYVSN